MFFGENFSNEETVTIKNTIFENISVRGWLFRLGKKCNTVICDCSFENLMLSANTLIYSEGIASPYHDTKYKDISLNRTIVIIEKAVADKTLKICFLGIC